MARGLVIYLLHRWDQFSPLDTSMRTCQDRCRCRHPRCRGLAHSHHRESHIACHSTQKGRSRRRLQAGGRSMCRHVHRHTGKAAGLMRLGIQVSRSIPNPSQGGCRRRHPHSDRGPTACTRSGQKQCYLAAALCTSAYMENCPPVYCLHALYREGSQKLPQSGTHPNAAA